MPLSTPDTPPTEVPEADWAEQAVAIDPSDEAEAENAVPANISRGIREADDADLVEQETVVYGEDDDTR